MRSQATVDVRGCVVRSDLRVTAKGFPLLRLTVAGDVPVVGRERGAAFYQQVQVLGGDAIALDRQLQPGVPVVGRGTLQRRRYTTRAGEPRDELSIKIDGMRVLEGEHETVTDRKGNARLRDGKNEVTVAGRVQSEPATHAMRDGREVTLLQVETLSRSSGSVVFSVACVGGVVAGLVAGVQVLVVGSLGSVEWVEGGVVWGLESVVVASSVSVG